MSYENTVKKQKQTDKLTKCPVCGTVDIWFYEVRLGEFGWHQTSKGIPGSPEHWDYMEPVINGVLDCECANGHTWTLDGLINDLSGFDVGTES